MQKEDKIALIGSLAFVFVCIGIVLHNAPPGPTPEERRARWQSVECMTRRELQIEIAKNTRVIAELIQNSDGK